jgi:hypothetical protein
MNHLEEIARAAAAFRAEPIEAIPFSLYRLFDETGDRLRYEAAYFSRRRRLVALGLAAWRWRRTEDIAALEDAIWAVCEEFTWALPAHLGGRSLESGALVEHETCLDLFACETAFALAELRDLLRAELAPAVAERARTEILRRVLHPFMARKSPWNWELMRNNWCAVCGGSVGAAALYLYEDGPELDAVLGRIYPTLENFLESFSEDGACLEGLGYWTYGVGFFVSFADLLLRRTNGRVDLISAPKFRRVAAFQSAAYLNDRLAVSFADSDPHERYRRGLSAYLARRFPEARLPPIELEAGVLDDPCGRWCLAFRDLLWGEGDVAVDASAAKNADRRTTGPFWFPDAQWLICPAGDNDGLAFAAKAGHNEEPHNHNDVGSFLLAKGDDLLIADLGAGEYVKDYFNENRYSIFCNASLSHSVPIIDGRGQEAGAHCRAHDVEFLRHGGKSVLSMDIAGAYTVPSLRGLKRRLEIDEGEILALEDAFFFDGPEYEVVERFVTCCAVAPAEEGTLITGLGASLLVVSADGSRPKILEHAHRDHSGRNVTVRSLDFHYDGTPGQVGPSSLSLRFVFRLM